MVIRGRREGREPRAGTAGGEAAAFCTDDNGRGPVVRQHLNMHTDEYATKREQTFAEILDHVRAGRVVRLKCPGCQPHEACHVDTIIDELCRREGGLRVTTAERLLAQHRWRETRAAAAAVSASASAKSLRLEETRVGDYYADLLAEAVDRGVHALEATIYAIASQGDAGADGSAAKQG